MLTAFYGITLPAAIYSCTKCNDNAQNVSLVIMHLLIRLVTSTDILF